MWMLTACSPGLDWREVRPEGGGVLALFPCKPEVSTHRATRTEPVTMGLAQCMAAGQSFALSWAEVDDATKVGTALSQMRVALAGKLSAQSQEARPLLVPGMTPNREAQQQALVGPQQQARMAVFARGQRVYQLVMLGTQRNEAAWETFLASIKLAA